MDREPHTEAPSRAPSRPARFELSTSGSIQAQPAPPASPQVPLQPDPRLSIPPLPPRLVSRPRLLDALDAAVRRAPLTLVTAGPGGGKSVLLSQWVRRRRPARTAWLALTRADNDPLRFWSLFLKAVRSAGPLPFPTSWSGDAVPALLDSLFAEDQPEAPPPFVVLDDAHLLTNPDVLDGLDRVIQRWSPRVRLVLATRSVPLLPLHRYRMSGQLAELRAADLAMIPDEACALFCAHGVTLTDEETGGLIARTEGWTGGLRLAALRMEASACPAQVAVQLAMDSGSIGEYLVEEVLAVQPEHVRRLLVETSLLDEVGGEAAKAITGIEGCETILADLARTNSFVVPLDPSHTRFRYHQLFREVLRHLARRLVGPAADEASRRATEWFRRNGYVANALQWALRSGDGRLARSVLVRGGLAQAFVSDQDLREIPLGDLLSGNPGDSDEDRAELAVARAAVAALDAQRAAVGPLGGQPTHVPQPADHAVPEPAEPEPADPELRVTAYLAQALSARATGDYGAMGSALDRLLADDMAGGSPPSRACAVRPCCCRPTAASSPEGPQT